MFLLVVKILANWQFKAVKLLQLFKKYHSSQSAGNLSIYENIFKNSSLKVYIFKIASWKNMFSKFLPQKLHFKKKFKKTLLPQKLHF